MQHFTAIANTILDAVAQGDAALASYNDGIREARKAAKGKTRDEVSAMLLPIVAARSECLPLVPGQKKAAGKMVLDSSLPHYNTAKSRWQRILIDICGKASPNAAKPKAKPAKKASAEAKAIAKALLAECEGNLARAVAILKAVA